MPTATSDNFTSSLRDCYHCGEEVPAGEDYSTPICGVNQAMCCPGCRAVAQLIDGSGMSAFYQNRTAHNERPNSETTQSQQHYDLYNNAEVNSGFTEQGEDGLTHARLLVGGITCAACTWLIEQTLLRLPGVSRAAVHLGQSRLDIEFDPGKVTTGELFHQVDLLGYRARPFQSSSQREQMASEYKRDLRQLAVAGLGMMQVGMFAIALHAGDLQSIEMEYRSLLRWVSLLVASFVLAYSARPFFVSAWRHLRIGTLVMDLPVSLAIGLAWLASLWATLTNQGQVYFDSVVMFTFFLLLGRFLERRARQKNAHAWIDAESTLPISVRVQRQGEWLNAARQDILPGELILVPAGETIPVDAVVTDGKSTSDESTFNGEHLPREIAPGDTIYAGTLNLLETLQARVQGSYVDTRLAALQRSIERAQLEKPSTVKLADRIASYFVGFTLLVTLMTAIVWSILDSSQVLWICLSVLVISCPCALALATPAALTGAANGLRRSGIIVRGENAIEALARSTHLIFDKTGTLTEGRLELCEVIPLSTLEEEDLLNLAAALQVHASHPLANAFSAHRAGSEFQKTKYHVGAGLEGQLDDRIYRTGSEAFCSQMTPTLPSAPDDNRYWIALCRDDEPLAWFGLEDSVREEAATVVTAAIQQGLQVELLTGDSSTMGQQLATALGIPTVNSGVSPQQKMDHVQQLQNEGAIVAMVGDGLNDAPVLAVADVSFAVAGATELARTQADFILVESDLQAVTHTWKRAKQCARIIQQNLGWALAYNLCGIPLAAMGYIPPWLAAIGMSASSLLVVINSLRLNRP